MRRSLRLERRWRLLTSPEMVMAAWLARREELWQCALAVRPHGVNWREFRTGQSSLCLDRGGNYHRIDSANCKPGKEDDVRHCAEEEPLVVCRERGWKLLCMALAARPMADDFTGVDIGWLIPCGKSCRPHMHRELDDVNGVLLPHSRLDLVNSRNKKVKSLAFPEMLALCASVNSDAIA